MAKRHLRIVKRSPALMVGVCEACNEQCILQLSISGHSRISLTVEVMISV